MKLIPLPANLESFPIGVMLTDLSGRVVACNRAAQTLFEIAVDPIDHLLRELDMAPGVPDLTAEVASIAAGAKMRRLSENRVRRRSGDPAILRVSLTPAVDAVGDRRGAIIAVEDRSRMSELEAAHRSEEYRHEFLAMLAHELRNPLSPIVSALNVIRRRAGEDETMQRARAVVERQVQHEARLLDDLLDVSRITTGKIELRKRRLDLVEAVDRALESARGLIEARQHTITRSLPGSAAYVDADAVRLEQVIVNLLNNAATYTAPRGHIHVVVTEEAGHAVLRVRDSGRGIPPEMLPHVFEMFTQFHTSIDRARGGLGIGLALVKSVVELHGGSVSAASEGRDRGSEFTVRLPMAEARTGAATDAVSASAVAGQRRVLIIEDNVDAREMLRAVLELDGHQVEVADNGLSGVEIGLTTHPDAVVLDIGLPGLDGYEVARRLRRHLGDDVRLIALTGYGQPEDRRTARQAGFDAHLTKPIDPEELSAILAARRPAES